MTFGNLWPFHGKLLKRPLSFQKAVFYLQTTIFVPKGGQQLFTIDETFRRKFSISNRPETLYVSPTSLKRARNRLIISRQARPRCGVSNGHQPACLSKKSSPSSKKGRRFKSSARAQLLRPSRLVAHLAENPEFSM